MQDRQLPDYLIEMLDRKSPTERIIALNFIEEFKINRAFNKINEMAKNDSDEKVRLLAQNVINVLSNEVRR